ncbi:PP2C family protein-serine/threonine phosphatase [Xylophilus ampelinus]|uniref:Protein phosphatase n=1 Tax=Xylophilus ampelinus TaxID=54067 RepID=A0A318SIB1_9BURK|nr:protein phosphatase 2C domain-containing protein [Xylophilus ampelinus]MCS4511251.1 protein phosphatase 2C domain-containing protein [Xylophilus ampelinus]PYE74995.1 protein phosphatase [Xylophilus ampelinus]
MHYEFHALSDTGRVRGNNEDTVAHDESLGLALLADGMGGYNAGEVASGIATDFVQHAFGAWIRAHGNGRATGPRELRRAMEICAEEANRAILEAAEAQPAYRGMGTTLVFCLFLPQRIMVGHIGDSRCYRLRGGELQRLTRDHSVLQEHIDAGLVDAAQASTVPYRNLVTRALGVDSGAQLDVAEHAPAPGDRYLICSDGLTDMLNDAEIAAILGAGMPMESTAAALVDAANAAGGRDNVSVLLAQAEGASPPLGRWARLLGRSPRGS